MAVGDDMKALNILAQSEPRAWNIACNGGGERSYFLRRNDNSDDLNSAAGNLIRYTAEGATRKALQLNRLEGLML